MVLERPKEQPPFGCGLKIQTGFDRADSCGNMQGETSQGCHHSSPPKNDLKEQNLGSSERLCLTMGSERFLSPPQPSPCSELMLNSATQQVMANCSTTAVLELGGWMAHNRGFTSFSLLHFFFFCTKGSLHSTICRDGNRAEPRGRDKELLQLSEMFSSIKLLHLLTANKEAPSGAGFGIIAHYLCCCTRSSQLEANSVYSTNRAPVFNAEVVICDLSNLPHQRKAEEPGESLNCWTAPLDIHTGSQPTSLHPTQATKVSFSGWFINCQIWTQNSHTALKEMENRSFTRICSSSSAISGKSSFKKHLFAYGRFI